MVNEAANPPPVRLGHQPEQSPDVDLLQRLGVISRLVVLAEVRRRVKDRLATIQRGGESGHVAHIPLHQARARVSKQALPLFLRSHQARYLETSLEEQAHQVVPQEAGASRDEYLHRTSPSACWGETSPGRDSGRPAPEVTPPA
jgi:hypothetical protein